MVRTVLDAWPLRRRVALVALLPLVATWFVSLGSTAPEAPSVAWYGVVLVASVLGAAVLAGYVPLVGRRPDLGCTPCATMSFLTLVGGSVALGNYGADIAGPLVAVALLTFGLTQRMTQPATCAAPGRRESTPVEPAPTAGGEPACDRS